MGTSRLADFGLEFGETDSGTIERKYICLYRRNYEAFLHSEALGCAFCGLLAKMVMKFRPQTAMQTFSATFNLERTLRVEFGVDGPIELFRLDGYRPPWEDLPYCWTVTTDAAAQDVFEFAQSRIDYCINNHSICSYDPTSQPPKRLLYFGLSPRFCRLVEDISDPVRYVALSHCWGNHQPLMTTLASLQERKRAIQWNELPPLFQDAVTIVQKMGLSYLWIDSLCIIQDSRDDWEVESSNMAQIYQNAYFTIAAAHTTSSHVTLLSPRPALYSAGIVFDINDTKVGARLVSRQDRLPLDERGWTLQEEYLSERILRFTEYELVWQCRQIEECECDAHDKPRRTSISTGRPLDKLEEIWPDIVFEYSKRRLTFSSDKLPALAGIATVVHRNTGDQYVAGLWMNTILKEMCWEPTKFLRIQTQWQVKPTFWDECGRAVAEYRAPSFSWASVDGLVELPTADPPSNLGQCKAILHDVQIELQGQNQFGQVCGGFLLLEGPAIMVNLICQEYTPPVDQHWDSNSESGSEESVKSLAERPSRAGASGKVHHYYLVPKDAPNDTFRMRIHPDTPLSTRTTPTGGLTIGRATEEEDIQPFQYDALALNIWHNEEVNPMRPRGRQYRTFLVLAQSSTVEDGFERVGLAGNAFLAEGCEDASMSSTPRSKGQDWFQSAESRVVKIF